MWTQRHLKPVLLPFPLHTHNTLLKGEFKNLSYNFMTLWLHTLKRSHIHLSLPKANNALTVGMLHIALGIHNFENLRELWLKPCSDQQPQPVFCNIIKPFLSTQPWRRPSTSNKHWETNWNILSIPNKWRKFNPKYGKEVNCLERYKWARV